MSGTVIKHAPGGVWWVVEVQPGVLCVAPHLFLSGTVPLLCFFGFCEMSSFAFMPGSHLTSNRIRAKLSLFSFKLWVLSIWSQPQSFKYSYQIITVIGFRQRGQENYAKLQLGGRKTGIQMQEKKKAQEAPSSLNTLLGILALQPSVT